MKRESEKEAAEECFTSEKVSIILKINRILVSGDRTVSLTYSGLFHALCHTIMYEYSKRFKIILI